MHNTLSYSITKELCKFKNFQITYRTYICRSRISSSCKPIMANVNKLHFSDRTNTGDVAKGNSHPTRDKQNLFSYTLQTQMANTSFGDANRFRLSDYDCIGFDLDNTLCMYKLSSMVKLEYEILANYLVTEKGHNPNFLLQPLEGNIDFIKKGLSIDFIKGNILQLRCDSYIVNASHGTHFMSSHEIEQSYGQDRKWDIGAEFTSNMLEAWNGPLSEKIRTLQDYFDMPASLAFARVVDSLDAKEGKPCNTYNVWPDVLDGLVYMYERKHFTSDSGGYFPALKANPDQYIHQCRVNVIDWLRSIKETKLVFLITGSNVDYASFAAEHSLGEDWRSLFDIVVCYARKPGFFTATRPFIQICDMRETDLLDGSELELGNIYSQGNWQDLYQLFQRVTGKKAPKCVYLGDNLIQDVYTPSEYTKCDTVAIVQELAAEGMINFNKHHIDAPVLLSECWGSYFCCDGKKPLKCNSYTMWGEIIRKHSKICIPSLDEIATHPLDFEFTPFVVDNDNQTKQLGYYPNSPVSLPLD